MAIQGTTRAIDINRTDSSESTLQARSRHSSGRVLLRHGLAGRARSASNIGAFLHWYPILSSPLDASLELRPLARSWRRSAGRRELYDLPMEPLWGLENPEALD